MHKNPQTLKKKKTFETFFLKVENTFMYHFFENHGFRRDRLSEELKFEDKIENHAQNI